jgi:hypothetical protein
VVWRGAHRVLSDRLLGNESLAIHRELGSREGIAKLLNNLVLIAIEQGDYAESRAFHEETLAIMRELGAREGIARSLNNLSLLAVTQQDYALARSQLGEGLANLRELGARRLIADALESCAALATAQDEPERAVRLWGAANALREEIGVPLRSINREKLDRDMAALRAALGAEAFATAWEAGHVMTWEQAVAYALEESGA